MVDCSNKLTPILVALVCSRSKRAMYTLVVYSPIQIIAQEEGGGKQVFHKPCVSIKTKNIPLLRTSSMTVKSQLQ